jgi:VanZ family protein
VTLAPGRRATLLRWLPVVGWMALIFTLSSVSGLRVSDDASVDRPFRVLGHLTTYAVLAALLLYALAGPRSPRWQHLLVAYAVCLVYGISDEIHQAFVPDRTGRIDDLMVDALGAAIGLVSGYLALRLWSRARSHSPSDG